MSAPYGCLQQSSPLGSVMPDAAPLRPLTVSAESVDGHHSIGSHLDLVDHYTESHNAYLQSAAVTYPSSLSAPIIDPLLLSGPPEHHSSGPVAPPPVHLGTPPASLDTYHGPNTTGIVPNTFHFPHPVDAYSVFAFNLPISDESAPHVPVPPTASTSWDGMPFTAWSTSGSIGDTAPPSSSAFTPGAVDCPSTAANFAFLLTPMSTSSATMFTPDLADPSAYDNIKHVPPPLALPGTSDIASVYGAHYSGPITPITPMHNITWDYLPTTPLGLAPGMPQPSLQATPSKHEVKQESTTPTNETPQPATSPIDPCVSAPEQVSRSQPETSALCTTAPLPRYAVHPPPPIMSIPHGPHMYQYGYPTPPGSADPSYYTGYSTPISCPSSTGQVFPPQLEFTNAHFQHPSYDKMDPHLQSQFRESQAKRLGLRKSSRSKNRLASAKKASSRVASHSDSAPAQGRSEAVSEKAPPSVITIDDSEIIEHDEEPNDRSKWMRCSDGYVRRIEYTSSVSRKGQHVFRRCANCKVQSQVGWRICMENPDHVVCNQCGIWQRYHGTQRPVFKDRRHRLTKRKSSSVSLEQTTPCAIQPKRRATMPGLAQPY